jgi:CDGSH-type Zn-finger protein
VAHACPSGAITYERLDGGPQESPPAVNVVRIRENGPLAFRADLRVDAQPNATRATLCRCGASQNKPYCDGGHSAAGFVASGEPATQPSEPLAQRGGALRVIALKDGPLQVEGNMEICSGTGRTVNRTDKAWLCRCGGSQNKPYCDGTHKRIGFRA